MKQNRIIRPAAPADLNAIYNYNVQVLRSADGPGNQWMGKGEAKTAFFWWWHGLRRNRVLTNAIYG
jgi:hypothetical protein